MEKVAEDSPDRCHAVMSKGQCWIKKEGYSNFCKMHSGHSKNNAIKKEAHKNYLLRKWHQRIADKATSPDIKSLRDEIGILRMVLEALLNNCNTETDLILQSAPISELVMKVDRVVLSCHKLEGSMGQLLDKASILQFAGNVINIIASEVEDTIILNNIATKIQGALSDE